MLQRLVCKEALGCRQLPCPNALVFSNATFAAKWAELKEIDATIVAEEQAEVDQAEALVSSAGLDMDVGDVDLQTSVEELLSKTPEQDKAATKRALDGLVGLHGAKKGKKESSS